MTTTDTPPGFRLVPMPHGVKGRLLLHSLPGRYEAWEDALAELGTHRVTRIVSLMPEREVLEKSALYARAIAANELPCERVVFPIRDYDIPQNRTDFYALAGDTAARIRNGEHVLVHCAAGRGRTGMFAMCVLVALGMRHREAVRTVSRTGSEPENGAQKKVVTAFARQNQGFLGRLRAYLPVPR